jgi:hypothetical protein
MTAAELDALPETTGPVAQGPADFAASGIKAATTSRVAALIDNPANTEDVVTVRDSRGRVWMTGSGLV